MPTRIGKKKKKSRGPETATKVPLGIYWYNFWDSWDTEDNIYL